MRRKKRSICLTATLAMFAVTFLATCTQVSAQETILHNFVGGNDGGEPFGSLIFDASGSIYGTTQRGGITNGGTVFKLTPSGGRWTERVLHTFETNGNDGQSPIGNLFFDPAGNLYGVTNEGGAHHLGTVFRLTPQTGGKWKENVLHSFGSSAKDGTFPYGSLIMDAAGNLYGTAARGGTRGNGIVFELTPKSGGGWTEKVLHNFTQGDKQDGRVPESNLIFDLAGNLYGTTVEGGGGVCHLGCGTVFELSPQSGGAWKEIILHRFQNDGKDGIAPYGSLIADGAGNLYGTTRNGGGLVHKSFGAVYQLTPQSDGSWTEKILYSFGNQGLNGEEPFGGVIFDTAGNLYGTTWKGGSANFLGTIYKLAPQTGGGWVQSLVHSFKTFSKDGSSPYAGLAIDASGNLFGTTVVGGGKANLGTVFEVTP